MAFWLDGCIGIVDIGRSDRLHKHGRRRPLDEGVAVRCALYNFIPCPDAVKELTSDLQAVGLTLASVYAVMDLQWISLGEAVSAHSKAAMNFLESFLRKVKTSLDRWTRRRTDGVLSWRDRATLGVFRRPHQIYI